jgi:hypothetical protein
MPRLDHMPLHAKPQGFPGTTSHDAQIFQLNKCVSDSPHFTSHPSTWPGDRIEESKNHFPHQETNSSKDIQAFDGSVSGASKLQKGLDHFPQSNHSGIQAALSSSTYSISLSSCGSGLQHSGQDPPKFQRHSHLRTS